MHPDFEEVLRDHNASRALIRDLTAAWAQVFPDPTPSMATTLPHGGSSGALGTFSDDETVMVDPPAAPPPSRADRYEDLGPLGVGGMGEIRRVRDRELNRMLAMKVIKDEMAQRPSALARFIEEAQCTAQLQHPGIVPIHDFGRLDDGRVWFTMKEVRGRTLKDVLKDRQSGAPEAWSFRAVVEAFRKVCEAVAYAHKRGVVHRDLKPENVMVGEHGEVLVLDWGLAKILGRPTDDADETSVITERSQNDSLATRMGQVAGTPAFMSPEQANGDVEHIDARSDVFALGGILYQILAGRPPYVGSDPMAVVAQVRAGPPIPVWATDAEPLPRDLVMACQHAMQREPEDRFASAEELVVEIAAWLDGARLRDQALAVVQTAEEREPLVATLREKAATLEASAEAMLASMQPWDPEADKIPAWTTQDEAAAARREADREEVALEQGLEAALRIDPSLPEAHIALASRFQRAHAAAEAARDTEGADRAETLLRSHIDALPASHDTRESYAAYLAGDGALTLITEPPGAEVTLFRCERKNRRLVEVEDRSLGRTPIVELPLPMGSYVCRISHPDCAPVRYPIQLTRGHHWDGVAPGETAPRAIPLPPRDALADDDCYVPPGWFLSGGDPGATYATARRRLWVDGLVMKRYPVTNRAYIAFLDDLVLQGREDEALRWVPREDGGTHGSVGDPVYGRTAAGGFELVPDAQGDLWRPDWPVLMVHWGCAAAYAQWLAEKTGQPWRLPGECEWEKAARGVDGRFFPWGDHLDPTWCCMRSTKPTMLPSDMDAHPVDTSVYGVRHTAGNAHVWCADRWAPDGATADGQRVVPPTPEDIDAVLAGPKRAARGGAWLGVERVSRSAERWGLEAGFRLPYLGFRPARSL